MRLATVLSVALILPAGASRAEASGDGQQVFEAQCAPCHSLNPAEIKNGPPLKGVVGRKSGEIQTFDYSDAMASAALTWNPATLNAYLQNPQAVVPGTKMAFAGLPDAKQREDLIAYLAAQH